MPEKASTAVKTESRPGAKSLQRDVPTTVAFGLASSLLDLQRAAGNRSVGRLLLQPKLRIGPPGDIYEREADQAADAVLRGDAPVSVSVVAGAGVQRMCKECEEEQELVQRKCHCQEEEEELVQPKSDGGQATPGFEARVAALRGAGRPLPSNVRSFFEPRFGHDFGTVRVHTGGAAREAAQAVNARAFTVGNDVVFGTGEWSPETDSGKRLLAHELTHVVQQTPLVARRKPRLQRAPEESGEPTPQEEEPAVSPEQESPAMEKPASETPAAEGEPAAALVVDDEAEAVGPGQMRKSDFLARLRAEVQAAIEEALAGTEHLASAGPLIELWLGSYEGQDTESINRDLPRFAGEGPQPATAEEYVSLIAARVRTSVSIWLQTGEVTGMPPGLALPGMDLLGGVFFKANPGGPRNLGDMGDPRALQARLGGGRPLEGSIRSRMESAFGRTFSHVRVHTDSGAAGLATSLNAKAFTVGEHVAFGAQEYRPGTLIGDGLIAHELAHVAQQSDGGTAAAGYETLERDADLAGASAVAALWGGLRARPEPRMRSGLRLQRCKRQKAATTTPAASSPTAFEPTPDTLASVTADAPFSDSEVTLGYTEIDEAKSQLECGPQFKADAVQGTCSFTSKPVNLKLKSKYVQWGEYRHPQNRTMPSVCGELPIKIVISDSISKLAKKGEEEHIADLQLAFNRTLKPCSEALQRLSGTTVAGKNDSECFADLVKKAGFDPADCTSEFRRLVEDSRKRDDKKWHTFEFERESANCEKFHVIYRPKAGKDNNIAEGKTSETVVSQATKCSDPSAAPASPPPTPPEKKETP